MSLEKGSSMLLHDVLHLSQQVMISKLKAYAHVNLLTDYLPKSPIICV